MSKFFKQLKEGLEEVLAHKKGKLSLHTEVIEIPEPPAEYTARDIRRSGKRGDILRAYLPRF